MALEKPFNESVVWDKLVLALSQAFRAHQFGEPGLFFDPKVTDLYHENCSSTREHSVNTLGATIGDRLAP